MPRESYFYYYWITITATSITDQARQHAHLHREGAVDLQRRWPPILTGWLYQWDGFLPVAEGNEVDDQARQHVS